MPLNEPGNWKYFLSHVQRECKLEAVMLANEWGKEHCWLDRFMEDKSVAAMEEGVKGAETFVCILSEGYFASEYCCNEMRWAFENGKPIVSTYKIGVNVGGLLNTAPDDFRDRIKGIDSIKLDADDSDFFAVCMKKITKRLGTLTVAAPSAERLAIEAELKKLQGTDINKADADGATPLLRACKEGNDALVCALIEAKAALDTQTKQGWTALMRACYYNHEHCARALIEAKADLEKVNQDSFTSLMISCQNGHEHCARALIEAGATVNHAAANGATALMLSAQNGHEHCARALIKANADPNKAIDAEGQNKGFTALMWAAQFGHDLCARALIEAGADVNKEGPQGFSNLMVACQNGHEHCARALIEAKAALDAQNNQGFTALMIACIKNHEHCARALIEAGARKDAKSNKGSTALSLARGHAAVCALLEG